MGRNRTSGGHATEVHQFVPSLGYRDAVGNHTLETQRALAANGYPGGIWVESVHPELSRRARAYDQYATRGASRRTANVLLYQASTGSNGLVDFVLERPETKLTYYHNITPSEFFEPYDPGASVGLETGRLELRRVCEQVAGAMANSEYSAQELRELGVEDVVVVPPYLSPRIEIPPSRSQTSWLQKTKRGIDVLFVGRVVPNKGHFELLRAFAALRASSEREPRLFVAGMWGPQLYMQELHRMRERLGSTGIAFTGSITDEVLAAHYQEADVFLCLSEHEGFCVPLVEAMRAGVPVIAYDAGAVAETLGGAGVLIRTLDPFVIAEVVAKVAGDATLRSELIEGQSKRVVELEGIDRDAAIVDCIRRSVDSVARTH